MPERIIATSLGLIAFSVAVFTGLMADSPGLVLFENTRFEWLLLGAEAVLVKAVFAMLVCAAAGWGIGWCMKRAVEENLSKYRREHPLEEEGEASKSAESAETGPEAEAEPAASVQAG